MRRHLKWKLVDQGKAMTIYHVASETNWSPIPLVNVDAKIMSKTEAIRIKMCCQTSPITIKVD